MRTGVIVLARSTVTDGKVAQRCADYLSSKGRKDVRIGYWKQKPDVFDLMTSMHDEGIDTFSILPLSISEGKNTVWLMPKAVSIPDNCGSWTMIDGKDVAIRFATALGADDRMADAILEKLGKPEKDVSVLIVTRGSPFSYSKKDVEYYSSVFRDAGWDVLSVSLHHGDGFGALTDHLRSAGIRKMKVVPFLVSSESRSFGQMEADIRKISENLRIDIEILPPVTDLPQYLDILDSKVPKGW